MAEVLVNTADFNANTPGTGDEVIVQDTTTVDVTTNVDQQGDWYDSMEAARGFIHDLGASGNPLRCNAKKLRLLHGGNAWVTADDNLTATHQMDDTLIDMMESVNQVYLTTETANTTDSAWHRIHINRGIVTMEADMEFDSNGMVSVGPGGVTLKLADEAGGAASGTALPWLNMLGGQCESDRTITRAYVGGGATLRQQTKPITYLAIGPQGTVKYWHTAGTVIEVQPGGTLDMREKRRQSAVTYIIVRKGGMLLGYESNLHTGTLIDER
jgi:hypothetical protein